MTYSERRITALRSLLAKEDLDGILLATGASFTDDELLARMDTAFRGFVALVRP